MSQQLSNGFAWRGSPPFQIQPPLRVLIVDDNALDRRQIRKWFNVAGVSNDDIEEACTFKAALDCVANELPHCIILDDYLGPVHRASETLPALRKLAPGAVICVASSVHCQTLSDELLDGSALSYFDKDKTGAEDIRQLAGFVRIACCLD